MNDCELLELAAKAAGLKPEEAEWTQRSGMVWVVRCADGIRKEIRWNPIDDDGDALRLAVKLRIRLNREINCGCDIVEAIGPEDDNMSCHYSTESIEGDPYAATRRAIVRAAAEIGKGIQLQTAEGVLEDNYYKSQAEAEELGRQMQEGGAA